MNSGHNYSNTGGGGEYVPFGYLGNNQAAVASTNWRDRPPAPTTNPNEGGYNVHNTTGTKAAYYGSMSKRGRGRGGSARGRGGNFPQQHYHGQQKQEVVKKAQDQLELLEKEERKKLQAALEEKIEKLTETIREKDSEISSLRDSTMRFEQAVADAEESLTHEKKDRELLDSEIGNILITLGEVEKAMGLIHDLTTPAVTEGGKDESQKSELAEMVFRLQQIKTAYTLQMDALLDRIGEVEAELSNAKTPNNAAHKVNRVKLLEDENNGIMKELKAEKEENRKLRDILASMEDNLRMGQDNTDVDELTERLKKMEGEKRDAMRRAKCVENENEGLKARLTGLQQANVEMMEQLNRGRTQYRR